MENRKIRIPRIYIGLATAFLVGSLWWALWVSGFFQAVESLEALNVYIQNFAPISHVIFFLLQLASVIIAPIPSNLTTAAGGFLFGPLCAFLISAGAVILGSGIVFHLSRLLGQDFVERFISQKNLSKYSEIIQKKQDTFLFLAFLFPFFPDDLLCIMAGLTKITFRRFLFLVIVARPWGLLVASVVGGSVFQLPLYGMFLLGIMGGLIFGFALKYGDRFEEKVLEKLNQNS